MKKYLGSAMVITMALCFLAAVVPLASVTLSLAIGLYLGAFLLALLWIAKLLSGKSFWNPSPMHYPVLGFMFYALFRYFTSPVEYEARLELFQIILLTFFYFVIAFNFHRSRDRSILLWTLFGLALFEATYGVWQFATQSPSILFWWSRPDKYINRAGGTFICPNHLAGFLEMVIGLVVGRLVINRSSEINNSALEKVLLVYVGLACIAGLMCSLSRSSWIALSVGLLTLLIWGDWKSRAFLVRLGTVAGCLAVLGLIAFSVSPIRKYIAETVHNPHVDKKFALSDRTLGGRTYFTKATFQMISEKPLLGTGPGTWEFFYPKHRPYRFQTYSEYPHNDVLNLCSDYGVIGLLLVAGALALFYRQAFRIGFSRAKSEQRALAVGAVISVTSLLVHSWTDFNLHIPANSFIFVSIIGLTVALGNPGDKTARKEMGLVPKYGLVAVLLALCVSALIWVTPTVRARIYFEKGTQAKDFLQWDEALLLYDRALSLDPRLTPLFELKGDLYRTMSEWRLGPDKAGERKELALKAVESYQTGLRQNPFQSKVLSALGAAYGLAGNDEAAEKTFKEALAMDPNGAHIYLAMGTFYRNTKQEEKALEAFKQAADHRWGYEDYVSAGNIEDLSEGRQKQ